MSIIAHTTFRGFAGRRLLQEAISTGAIVYAGNISLKIYGRMDCSSGMRMKAANRVFFSNETEAINAGYRPCGSCLKKKYNKWKTGT